MSHQAIAGFWQKLDGDAAVRGELDALMTEGGELSVTGIVALGSRHGFTFTASELEVSLRTAAGGELSDAVLESVAGGAVDYFLKLEGIKVQTQSNDSSALIVKFTRTGRVGLINF
jgi:predicted ribosomally synthesized peptide with nif11-like leader